MNSVILQIASKYLRFLLIIFALLALFRGHNQPGGGFIGGSIHNICYDVPPENIEALFNAAKKYGRYSKNAK